MVTRVQFTVVACLLAALPLASCLLLATAKPSTESVSPVELVRQAVNNEVASNRESNRRFMFKDVKKTAHLNQVKLIVETKEATRVLDTFSPPRDEYLALDREDAKATWRRYIRENVATSSSARVNPAGRGRHVLSAGRHRSQPA